MDISEIIKIPQEKLQLAILQKEYELSLLNLAVFIHAQSDELRKIEDASAVVEKCRSECAQNLNGHHILQLVQQILF